MVITFASEVPQVTRLFTFCLLASLKVPLAVKPCVVEGASTAEVGVTAMDWRVAVLTVRLVDPVFDISAMKAAVIVVVPPPTPVAVAPDMVATDCVPEDQVQSPVIVWLDPSLKAPVATKLWLVKGAIVGVTGVTVID